MIFAIFLLEMVISQNIIIYPCLTAQESFSLYFGLALVIVVNNTGLISDYKVKETSKLGPRPEKPIEIYEFERYFSFRCLIL